MIDRRLQVLRTVALRGTVTGAAEALHYTPSAVSQQLKSLARELGVDLVEQEGRRLRLTPAGRTLLAHADDLFEHWERVRSEVVAGADTAAAALRLCGFSTAAAALLPAVAGSISDRHPRCQVTIIEAEPAECFELLLTDQADVAVVVATGDVPPFSDRRFDLRPLLDDPLDILLPRGHRLASRTHLRLRDLSEEGWVMDRPGRPYHQLLVTACAAAGFTPTTAHHASEWETGAALVAAGLGVAVIPRLAHAPIGYDLVRVPLAGEPAPSRQILTGTRRGALSHPVVITALDALAHAARASTSPST